MSGGVGVSRLAPSTRIGRRDPALPVLDGNTSCYPILQLDFNDSIQILCRPPVCVLREKRGFRPARKAWGNSPRIVLDPSICLMHTTIYGPTCRRGWGTALLLFLRTPLRSDRWPRTSRRGG